MTTKPADPLTVALEALADYASRYAPVAKHAGLTLPAGVADRLEVV